MKYVYYDAFLILHIITGYEHRQSCYFKYKRNFKICIRKEIHLSSMNLVERTLLLTQSYRYIGDRE